MNKNTKVYQAKIGEPDNLDTVIKSAVYSDLTNLNYFNLDYYARKNHETLKALYDNKIIDDQFINTALDEIIDNQVEKDLETIIKIETNETIHYVDYIVKPEILAYAIKNKRFDERKISKILFDYGDTAKSFVRQYGASDIISELREMLIHPKPRSYLGEDFDFEHPVCNCGN